MRWIRVYATREGLVGRTTAAGLRIRPESHFVALPSRKALWRIVAVRHDEVTTLAPVLDVGPWFPYRSYPDDDYWEKPGTTPRAHEMVGQIRKGDQREYRINGAGIDLSEGVCRRLGIRGNTWLLWKFVEPDEIVEDAWELVSYGGTDPN